MRLAALAIAGVVILATEKLDVVVVLIKVEVQIAAALGTLHHAGKGAWLLGDGGALAPGSGLQRLYLFPSGPINNSLVNIEEDRPVFLRVFDPALHLVGFGVAFEVWNRPGLYPCCASSRWG